MFHKLRRLMCYALLGATFGSAAPAHAGLVWFSRANCVNNESITWDWPGNNYWLWTNSHHYKARVWHVVQTGWQWTNWSPAAHLGEGFSGGYFVVGNHYRFLPGYGEFRMGHTETTQCNLGKFFHLGNSGDFR